MKAHRAQRARKERRTAARRARDLAALTEKIAAQTRGEIGAAEVALITGLSLSTVRKLCRGAIPATRRGGRLVVQRADVLRYLVRRAKERAARPPAITPEQVATWLAEGLCVDCGAKRDPQSTRRCAAHLERQRVAACEYAQRQAAGTGRDLISCPAAAALAGITATSMIAAAKSGRVRYFRVGSHWRFREQDVRAFARKRAKKGRRT